MSLVKVNSAQIGQSATATQNFTLAVPASPDGTVKLARGNSGATTQDVLTVDASGNVNAPVGLQQGGVATGRMVLGTSQATTSGTSVSFTSIPSWAKRITVLFNGVSVSGTASLLVQIGSGSTTTSSYSSESSRIANGTVSALTAGNGFVISMGIANDTATGQMVLTNIINNTWLSSHAIGNSVNTTGMTGGGIAPNLAGALDRVVITTSNGTDTFDAGTVNILYEG